MERMEQRLCEAAILGSVQSLHEIIAEDGLILDKIVEGCFSGKCPLHVAASRGQTQFVVVLLQLKQNLAGVLDSHRQSALHVAAAKGHLEIVHALIKASHEMCSALDQDGRNPLHIAAMNGHVEVLKALVQISPQATRVKVDQGETILHLCVKQSQLQTLELLLKFMTVEFVNAKDAGGTNILHLAVLDRRFEIMKLVLTNSAIDVNAKNASGHTALDILLLTKKKSDTDPLARPIEDFLRVSNGIRSNYSVRAVWQAKQRDALMVVSSLITTIAFQAGVIPPGGVWQDNSDGHNAGEAIMAYTYPRSYPYFLHFNTAGFIISLSTILFFILQLPSRNKIFVWIRAVFTWLTSIAIATTYAFAIVVVTPKNHTKSPSRAIVVAIIVWCSVMTVIVVASTIRSISKVVKETHSRYKALERTSNLHRQPCWIKIKLLLESIIIVSGSGNDV